MEIGSPSVVKTDVLVIGGGIASWGFSNRGEVPRDAGFGKKRATQFDKET